MKRIIKFRNVITKEGKREEADRLNKDFYRALGTEAAEPEEIGMDATPEEELSCRITDHLAQRTAERFTDMMDGRELEFIREIIRRLDSADSETAIEMLQSMFLINGNDDYAKDLDLVNICAMYNESAYDDFIYELFDTDEFDWFLVDICLSEACEKACLPACLN